MTPSESTPLDAIWAEIGERFDRSIVERYRVLALDPARAFDTARNDFRGEVAVLAHAGHDINRAGAKQTLILGHVLLAILDGLRRGRRAFNPLPPRRRDWASEETSLLLWAAQHGASDVRESRVQETEAGGRM